MKAADFFKTYGNTAGASWSGFANFVRKEDELFATLADLYGDKLRPLTKAPSYKQELYARIQSDRVRSYLETGVNEGESLLIAKDLALAIGIDPAPKVPEGVFDKAPFRLVQKPSDEFFLETYQAGEPDFQLDLAFIDGLHVFEYALRDFIGCEALAAPGCEVLIHDVLPRRAAEAARHRFTRSWTGDVWRVPMVLRHFRPDLHVQLMESAPTGLALISGFAPGNTVLMDRYAEVVAYGLSLSILDFMQNRDTHIAAVPTRG
jgi:hypothetical protein